MPLKSLKTDQSKTLTLEWRLHAKSYKLSLDKESCVGCQICSLACPKEAITIHKQSKLPGKKTKPAKIDIDLKKCNFCGICDIICPYGAIMVTVTGQPTLSVLDKESFPQLTREIQVDSSKYPKDSVECEEACPLDLIKVTRSTVDEEGKPRIQIEVDQEHCPCCRVCEFKCPNGVINVKKIFHGKIEIHPEECPEDCTDCIDVCPITDALYISEDDGKVRANDLFCVYCGACKVVCPVEQALDLKRTLVRHSPISSGAWNKALERITSPSEMTKELKAKGSQKARDSVKKRLGWRTA
ncbi:MAG: 4Fe-4S dicluster domain-containing protein [Candidatus Bathyarchaeota archaeon]|jgi:4Fe-4S ferredoxin